ncbi:MAG: hypothetical protein IH851_03615 [Armatimonadetes bacterium]|nr:hypothetical protein [Armatimonadota bacterium]
MRLRPSPWILALSVVSVVFGCTCGEGLKQGTLIKRPDKFFPDTWKHAPASLVFPGFEVDAELELMIDGTRRTLRALRDGDLMDEEVYIVTTEVIEIEQIPPGAGERFDPPIPLLWSSMRIGDEREWKGKVLYGKQGIPTEATVKTSVESVTLATGPAETVYVEVNLRMDDGSPKKAERRLRFWFVKGEGPVKRDFGEQVREPRAESDADAG